LTVARRYRFQGRTRSRGAWRWPKRGRNSGVQPGRSAPFLAGSRESGCGGGDPCLCWPGSFWFWFTEREGQRATFLVTAKCLV